MEPREEPPIKTKRYDELERELYTVTQKIDDLNEIISNGDTRLEELLSLSIQGLNSGVTLSYPTTAINLLDKKLEAAVKEIPELEKQKKDKGELLDLFENELLKEGWNKQVIIFGPAKWVKIKKE